MRFTLQGKYLMQMTELQRLLTGCGDDNYIDKACSTNREHVWPFHIVAWLLVSID